MRELLYSQQEVMELLMITPEKLREYETEGRLNFQEIGGDKYYSSDDKLENLIGERNNRDRISEKQKYLIYQIREALEEGERLLNDD